MSNLNCQQHKLTIEEAICNALHIAAREHVVIRSMSLDSDQYENFKKSLGTQCQLVTINNIEGIRYPGPMGYCIITSDG